MINNSIYYFAFVPVVVIVVTAVSYLVIAKKWNPIHFGSILGGIHFISVLVLSYFIYQWLQQDSDASFVWFIFAFIDPPVYYLWVLIDKWSYAMNNTAYLFNNFYLPFICYSILGSLEYFGLGFLIAKLCIIVKDNWDT